MRRNRPVTGEHIAPEVSVTTRVVERAETFGPPRPKESTRDSLVWDHRPVPIDPKYRVEPARPAPLLKRVIRYPATMEPLPPERVQVFDGSRETTQRAAAPQVPMTFRDHSEMRAAPSPLRDIDLGLEPRIAPFARARRARDEVKR